MEITWPNPSLPSPGSFALVVYGDPVALVLAGVVPIFPALGVQSFYTLGISAGTGERGELGV